MTKGRWGELCCKCVTDLYIQLHSIISSSLQGRPFWMLFIYVSVFFWALLLTDLTGTLILLTQMMNWSIAQEQVQNWPLMIFTHNSICMNNFCSAQPLLTCLSDNPYIFHNSCVNYCNFQLNETCFYVPVSPVYWNLYSHVGDMKRRLFAFDRIKSLDLTVTVEK